MAAIAAAGGLVLASIPTAGLLVSLSIVIMHTLIRTVREQQFLHSHGLAAPALSCSHDPARFLARL